MTNLNFILVDPFQFRKAGSVEADMKSYLDTKLNDLVSFSNSHKQDKKADDHTFKVSFTETKPVAGDLDFVIYLIHSLHTSLIEAKDRKRVTTLPGDHWGRTQVSGKNNPDKKFAAELRVMAKDGARLGATALHEFYHAKEQAVDGELHPKGGICAAATDGSTALNSVNRNDFSAFISSPVKPYLDDVSFLSFSKTKYDKDQASDWWDFLS